MLPLTSFGRRLPSWLSMRFPSKSLKYESLKTCTTRRWLFNEDAQMALRTLDFDVDALGKVAAQAAGASKWTDMKLIAEGEFNRVLGISLDNGQEVVARMPFPNAGPRRLMTSSEVATMDFLRTRLAAPVPKVLAWNASSDSDVGTEYIIMEKCPGDTLSFDEPTPAPVIRTAAKIMTQLAAIPFSRYGSIYYKEDVDPSLQEWPLYADSELHDDCSEKFRIGPTVDRQFYRGGRAHLSIDRGPWTDTLSYLKALVDCEVKWIKTHSNTPAAKKQPGNSHTAHDHLTVLEEWLQLAPAVLPAPQYCAPTLLRPALDSGDILCFQGVSKDPDFTILDWQGASVQPLFQATLPEFVFSSNNVATVPADITRDHLDLSKNNMAMTFLLEELEATSIDLHCVLSLFCHQLFRITVHHSSHSWSIGLPALEYSLMGTPFKYGKHIPINEGYPVCPLSFDENDLAKTEEELIPLTVEVNVYKLLQGFLEEEGISLGGDGSVAAEDFERAISIIIPFHKVYDGFSRIAFMVDRGKKGAWPLREGKYVYNMESCT